VGDGVPEDAASLVGDDDHLPAGQGMLPVGDEVVVDDLTMRRALEAILMVTDEPLPVLTLARAIGRPTGDIAGALAELAAEYTEQGRGFDLREVGGGWRYYTRADSAQYVERFVLDGQQSRITQAALETLAVVAYKQPVSRARVSAIRGVNVDGVMRTLVARGLVEEAGADTESQATLYRTSTYFLERMGMQSLDDLPELAPYLPEMDDIEEELAAQSLPPTTSNSEPEEPAGTADAPDPLPAEAEAQEPAEDSNPPKTPPAEAVDGMVQQQPATDNNASTDAADDNPTDKAANGPAGAADSAEVSSADAEAEESAGGSDSAEASPAEAVGGARQQESAAEGNDSTDAADEDSTDEDPTDEPAGAADSAEVSSADAEAKQSVGGSDPAEASPAEAVGGARQQESAAEGNDSTDDADEDSTDEDPEWPADAAESAEGAVPEDDEFGGAAGSPGVSVTGEDEAGAGGYEFTDDVGGGSGGSGDGGGVGDGVRDGG
jgi:segregation and condensation protein B